jgi:hypothetical protein
MIRSIQIGKLAIVALLRGFTAGSAKSAKAVREGVLAPYEPTTFAAYARSGARVRR